MSDSIIEQVRTLVQSTRPLCNPNIAHADEDGDTTCRHCGIGMYCGEERHCSSQKSPYDTLLAHIATQAEALKVAVEALKKYSDPYKYEDRGMGILVAPDDATAALSRIAALTGETK